MSDKNDLSQKENDANSQFWKKEAVLRKMFPDPIGTLPFYREVQRLCAEYLGGVWEETLPEPVSVTLLTGGLINFIFAVRLPESVSTKGEEPRAVILRIYGNVDSDCLLTETVITALLSQREELGPSVFGVFPSGRIEELIPSRNLTFDEFCNVHVGKEMGRILAILHSLEMPTPKRVQLFDLADQLLERLRESPRWQRPHPMKVTGVPLNDNCPKEISIDLLEKELNIVKECLSKSGSPLVFSSNDTHEDNTLLRDCYELTEDGFKGSSVHSPLVLIDYEYAGFNYRGFDLCDYCVECCNTNKNPNWPGYVIDLDRWPKENDLIAYVGSYLDEAEKIAEREGRRPRCLSDLPKDRKAAIERLVTEVERFAAWPQLFVGIWSWRQAELELCDTDYAFFEYGFDRLALYFLRKPKMLEYLK